MGVFSSYSASAYSASSSVFFSSLFLAKQREKLSQDFYFHQESRSHSNAATTKGRQQQQQRSWVCAVDSLVWFRPRSLARLVLAALAGQAHLLISATCVMLARATKKGNGSPSEIKERGDLCMPHATCHTTLGEIQNALASSKWVKVNQVFAVFGDDEKVFSWLG